MYTDPGDQVAAGLWRAFDMEEYASLCFVEKQIQPQEKSTLSLMSLLQVTQCC